MIFEKQILDIYKGMAYTRCDDNGTAFYFSASDFEGLHADPYSFCSSMGHILNGYLYYYDNVKEGRIIVFDHGFGGGHSAYMKEIELLCRQGYLVLAYDHTGCMSSGGATPNGMAQSLCDLNDCIESIKDDERFDGMRISVIGHSWGGFSTLNISALHPEITHIVVFSGFVSVEMLVEAYFSGLLKPYRKPVLELEQRSNPVFSKFNAIESLKKSSAKALLIYSDNDKLCSKKVHYDALVNGLSDRSDVEFILESGKGHNPNYTSDAVAHLSEYIKAKNKLTRQKKLVSDEQKKEFLASFDWDRMTAQDMEVWKRIFRHLEE
jgi:pimeloyl-ACP methyl ester carboxylesterase